MDCSILRTKYFACNSDQRNIDVSERVRWWAGVRGVIWKQKEKVRKTTNENILDTCNMWQVEIVVDEKLLIKTNTHTHTHTHVQNGPKRYMPFFPNSDSNSEQKIIQNTVDFSNAPRFPPPLPRQLSPLS